MSPFLTQYLAATGAFFLTGLLFSLAERRWPLRPVDRRRELGLDVFGFLLSWHLSSAVVLLGGLVLEAWAPRPMTGGMPGWLRGVVFFLAADFFKYAVHALMHTRWLWPVHRFHHSPEQLWWFSGNRASVGHVVLHFLPTAVLGWLLDAPPSWVMANAGINILWNHVMHANVAWPAAAQRAFEWLLVTPRYHHVHHARAPELSGRNLASVLTVWDHLFGTAARPERMVEGTPFGVEEPLPSLARLAVGTQGALASRFSLVLLGVLAALPFLRDTEHQPLTDEVRARASGRYVRLSQGLVHYEVAGPEHGQPVVLVHGLAVPAYVWDPTFHALAEAGFRVIRYDLYGRGLSDRPEGPYDGAFFTRQLRELLSALGVERPVDVIGLSMGGSIAGAFTASHPERVRKLVLIAPHNQAVGIGPLGVPVLGEYLNRALVLPMLPAIQEALGPVEFVAIPEAGHLPHYEQPERVNPTLIRFLGQ